MSTEESLRKPHELIFRDMVRALSGHDRTLAEQTSRQLKKGTKTNPEALYALRHELFQAAIHANDVRVRWNLIIVLGRLPLKGQDRAALIDWLFERLRDQSPLTRTFALQALWNLSSGPSVDDMRLRARVLVIAEQFLVHGTAAMRARARRLIEQ